MLVVTGPRRLPSSSIPSNTPQARHGRWEGDGGETQRALLHRIARDSPRQHDKNKRNTYSCVVFLSTTSYTGGGHISRPVAKEQSPVCDISSQSQCRGCPSGEGAGETSPYGPIMRTASTPRCSSDVPSAAGTPMGASTSSFPQITSSCRGRGGRGVHQTPVWTTES